MSEGADDPAVRPYHGVGWWKVGTSRCDVRGADDPAVRPYQDLADLHVLLRSEEAKGGGGPP